MTTKTHKYNVLCKDCANALNAVVSGVKAGKCQYCNKRTGYLVISKGN